MTVADTPAVMMTAMPKAVSDEIGSEKKRRPSTAAKTIAENCIDENDFYIAYEFFVESENSD